MYSRHVPGAPLFAGRARPGRVPVAQGTKRLSGKSCTGADSLSQAVFPSPSSRHNEASRPERVVTRGGMREVGVEAMERGACFHAVMQGVAVEQALQVVHRSPRVPEPFVENARVPERVVEERARVRPASGDAEVGVAGGDLVSQRLQMLCGEKRQQRGEVGRSGIAMEGEKFGACDLRSLPVRVLHQPADGGVGHPVGRESAGGPFPDRGIPALHPPARSAGARRA